MTVLKKYLESVRNPIVNQVIFWLLIFLFSANASSWHFETSWELIETYSIRVLFQIITALICIRLLIPKILNKGYRGYFILAVIGSLVVLYFFCTFIRLNYLELKYPATYVSYLKRFDDPTSLWSRLTYLPEFLSVSLYFAYPTFLLLAIRFYREQQRLIKLNEQKKTAELALLKNQLNPHFLFNTLNNLYALAFKKSDQTIKVIEKLSGILDYTLYGCNKEYVSINKEVELIENYLVLERVRYGNRVDVRFDNHISKDLNIAPLLLLTYIENAFKHGVSQELETAEISISLTANEKEINFEIENSKAGYKLEKCTQKNGSIGLRNVQQQLDLLYPEEHSLEITNSPHTYKVNLILAAR
ncbi:MAG: histidine kinase [Cyclobacteriaceae bacterium]